MQIIFESRIFPLFEKVEWLKARKPSIALLLVFCFAPMVCHALDLRIQGNKIEVSFQSELQYLYELEVSDDLVNWKDTGHWCHGTSEEVVFSLPLEAPVFFRLIVTPHSSQTYFISPTGNDLNTGTSPEQPWFTIQQAADRMNPGDVCYLRGGTYRQTVRVPIGVEDPQQYRTFRSYPGERAILRGDVTVPDSQWTLYEGNIYQATWNQPVPDLYIQDQLVWIARWPDAGTNDPLRPVFSYMDPLTPSRTGTRYHQIIDSELTANAGSLDGAKVWFTGKERWWARGGIVYDHPGIGRFTLQLHPNAPDNELWSGVLPAKTAPYFLYDHFQLLDSPGEWYYNDTSKVLYLWSPDNQKPRGVTVYRHRWIIDISQCHNVRLMDMEFFAGSINAVESQSCIMEYLKLRFLDSMPYIAHVRERERDFSLSYGAILTGIPVSGSYNRIAHCEISNTWGDAVCVDGSDNVVEANWLHDLNYYGTMAGVSFYGVHNILRSNTIHRMGRSGVRNDMLSGGLFEFNHIYDVGRINWDLGGIYMYNTPGNPIDRLIIRYNRIHDIQLENNEGPTDFQYSGSGIYIDGSSASVNAYRNLVYRYRRYGVQLNGDSFHRQDNAHCDIAFNTLWDNASDPLSSPTGGIYYEENGKVDVQFRYNAYASFQDIYLAGVAPEGNLPMWPSDFTDFANDDFSLNSTSIAVDSGIVIPGITDDFAGGNPDVGAYEFGLPEWQAGIPENSSTTLPVGPLGSE